MAAQSLLMMGGGGNRDGGNQDGPLARGSGYRSEGVIPQPPDVRSGKRTMCGIRFKSLYFNSFISN